MHYVCVFGKKRLPEIIERIWNNVESFQEGYLKLNDCITGLKENGIVFNDICEGNLFKNKQNDDNEPCELDEKNLKV